MKFLRHRHQGVGLIEVLITTVVIAVGLLAVASLQGDLIGSSGVNKTRSEAKSLCETKLEQLRDTVTRGATGSTTAGEYNAISSSIIEDEIAGSNEVIRRSWTVTDLTDPDRKKIDVLCRWDDAASPDTEKQVAVQGIVTFESLKTAAILSEPAGAQLLNPSTNANSSDEINDDTDVTLDVTETADTLSSQDAGIPGAYLKVNADGTTGTIVFKCTGETATGVIPFIPFDESKGLYTRRVVFEPNGSSFREAIELAKSNEDNLFGTGQHSCSRKIRYNGGVMLPLKGTVYSKTGSNQSGALIDINLFTFDASESGIFCHFEPDPNSNVAPYVCYAGGNCVNGPFGTHKVADGVSNDVDGVDTTTTDDIHQTGTAVAGDNTSVLECPAGNPNKDGADTTVYGANIYGDVGPGGWRGQVGLLGIPTSNAAHNNVCFQEEITPGIETYVNDLGQTVTDGLNTARNYFTRRGTGTAARNEGINLPYSCHDFLVIDGKNTKSQVDAECENQAGMLNLASKNIMRDFTSATDENTPLNTVILSAETSHCTSITGTVTAGATTVTAIAVSPVGANGVFDCTVNTTTNTYQCLGTANGVNIGTNASPNYLANVEISDGTNICTVSVTANPSFYTCDLATAATTRNVAVTVTDDASTVGTTIITAVVDSGGTFTCAYGSGTNDTGAVYNCTVPTTWSGTITAVHTCNGLNATDAVSGSVAAGTADTTAAITLPVCAAATTRSITVTINTQGAGNTVITNVTGTGATCTEVTTGTGGATYNCVVPASWSDVITATSTCNGGTPTDSNSITIPVANTAATINLPTCASVNRTLTISALTNGSITCNGSTCASTYTDGTTVFLNAVPASGYAFGGWTGDCAATTGITCTLDMTADKTVGATFVTACDVSITGGANNKNDTITADGTSCAVSPAKAITCVTRTNVADGTIINVTSSGTVNSTQQITVACPTTGYTVNF